MSEQAIETPATPDAPAATPEAPAVPTLFTSVPVSVRRNADKGLWEAYVTLGGSEWVIASRKLGGLDDDLQEAATPGFKEKRRLYYEREILGLR